MVILKEYEAYLKVKRFIDSCDEAEIISKLRLLTHVRLVRQNVLILSDVSLYVERSKNLEKKYVITVQKNSPS